MKLYIEGRISRYIEDVFTLDAEEEAEYRALRPEERPVWLGDLAREMAWDSDSHESRLDEIEWRVQDDD